MLGSASQVSEAPQQQPRASALLGPVTVTFADAASGLSWSVSIATLLEYGGLNLGGIPDVLMSANLPDGIRGYPYTGTISAMNIGGATGDITITVDALPAGLTLGATTTTDHQTYTAIITGTLQ
ncbi:MAG TPA: hypothetical protein VFP92_10930 [Rhodanobacteraceae bacterium]|nr:hypothetical protein [Rhodanobacteraceae bacterium]